jgi:hypothetical protein
MSDYCHILSIYKRNLVYAPRIPQYALSLPMERYGTKTRMSPSWKWYKELIKPWLESVLLAI